MIEDIALQKKAPITAYDRDYQIELEASHLSGQSFSYYSSKREKASYQVALLGHHQARNAALAISICDVLFEREGRGLLSKELVDEALRQVVWPGRMEVISQKPMILLDGAHNPHAVAPLIASLRELFPSQKRPFFLPASGPKPWKRCWSSGRNWKIVAWFSRPLTIQEPILKIK